MPKASRLGDIFKHGPIPTGALISGSMNVITNGRPAALTTISMGPCAREKGMPQMAATGSNTVKINGMSAVRVGDKMSCGATMAMGSSNVIIGG